MSTVRSDPYDIWVPFLLYLFAELNTITALYPAETTAEWRTPAGMKNRSPAR